MIKDYELLLENLKGRRYDEARRESALSDAFEECGYNDCIRYCLESMQEIDVSYAYKAFYISKRIQEKLQKGFEELNTKVDFRYQGAIQTETNITLYGDLELMVIIDAPEDVAARKIKSITAAMMHLLTLETVYQSVDNSDKTRIIVTTSKPNSEISILPALWIDNPEFRSTRREIDRGVAEFNLGAKTKKRYLPFKNMARVNAKDRKTNGGLKKLIRLLRNLQKDADSPITLSEYEIAAMVYAIPEKQLQYSDKHALSLLGICSAQLHRITKDQEYLEKMVSPSERELVFGKKPGKHEQVSLLNHELDMLISDLKEALTEDKKNLYSEITYG